MDAEAGDGTLLRLRDVTLRFGGVVALSEVDVAVRAGDICGLVGPNGAGKTSLFNCISGYYRPSSGAIELDGVDVLGRPPHAMMDLGIARTFQHPLLQADRSVLDNVLLGGHHLLSGGLLGYLTGLPRVRRQERELAADARELLELVGVAEPLGTAAGDLPFGSQKRVELARALLSGPRLLLLDEPASGLTHSEVDDLSALIRRIRDERGVTVVVVEHHMGLISAVTDHVVALVTGAKVAEGPASEIQNDPAVVAAYLGAA